MLPTTQEYKISLMIGEDSFRTLKEVEVIPNPTYPAEPWFSTGGLAIVFKIKMKEKFYALKCFYAEANERQERLGHIATYLQQNPSPYVVDFKYLDNELWVETAQGGNGYPVVLMEWIEGKTLDNYLEGVCKHKDKIALQNLYFQFCNLAWWLQQQPIAHGDLKHDNLIVTTEGKLKLIDYDGMFVPALSGRKANELGSPCYQHPQRGTHFFNKDLDDFSLLILQITLLALQHEPSLFTKHYNGDGILLKDTDYRNFSGSSIKTTLWQLPEVKLPLLLSQVQASLSHLKAIDLMPLVQDVEWINWLIAGQKQESVIITKVTQRRDDIYLTYKRKNCNELILSNKRWKDLFIKVLCRNHSINSKLIQTLRTRHNWDKLGLSSNTALTWSLDLIERYKDKWQWKHLSRNPSLPWSLSFIERYKDKWQWGSLSSNTDLPWSLDLIKVYQYRWTWSNLSNNPALPWSLDLIKRYQDEWEWGKFGLSSNTALPWSLNFIERYQNKWYWGVWGLSSNTALPWCQELMVQYQNEWDWESLSRNPSLPWSLDFIERYQNKWHWGTWGLSSNTALPWSLDFIERYQNKWDWGRFGLSHNTALPWSLDFIEKHQLNWHWGAWGLSANTALPWSLDFIERYQDKWQWKGNGLSSNTALPWSLDFIEKYQDKWDWDSITGNPSVYEKVFKPLLDDEFIDEIMSSLSQ